MLKSHGGSPSVGRWRPWRFVAFSLYKIKGFLYINPFANLIINLTEKEAHGPQQDS